MESTSRKILYEDIIRPNITFLGSHSLNPSPSTFVRFLSYLSLCKDNFAHLVHRFQPHTLTLHILPSAIGSQASMVEGVAGDQHVDGKLSVAEIIEESAEASNGIGDYGYGPAKMWLVWPLVTKIPAPTMPLISNPTRLNH